MVLIIISETKNYRFQRLDELDVECRVEQNTKVSFWFFVGEFVGPVNKVLEDDHVQDKEKEVNDISVYVYNDLDRTVSILYN